jgi:hypothetical protein
MLVRISTIGFVLAGAFGTSEVAGDDSVSGAGVGAGAGAGASSAGGGGEPPPHPIIAINPMVTNKSFDRICLLEQRILIN